MRPIRIAGVVALSILAVGATASASASAAPPEFGHCVKAEGRTGEYNGAKCTTPNATHKGTYNWVPGPGPKPTFSSIGESVVLETPGGKQKIQCGGATFDGEYTGPKTENVTISLIGCVNSANQQCRTSPAAEGEIEGSEVGELGFIVGGEKPKVGVDIKPKSPSSTVFTFSCGKPPEVPTVATVEGSVIGSIIPINKMAEEFKLTFKQSGGVQSPQQFEGGAKDTLTAQFIKGIETTKEELGLKVLYLTSNEEPIEIKAK